MTKLAATTRAAFTLLEFLVASVLAAVLMVALLLVMGSLGHDRGNVDRIAHMAAERDLVQIIRNDLLASTTLQRERQSLVLTGHGGLDPETLRPSQLPAVIEYRILTGSGRGWLIRRQRNLGTGADANQWTELACGDVKSMDLAAIDPPSKQQPTGGGQSNGSMPARLRLTLHWGNPGRPPLDQVIVLNSPARQ